jgi:hypothetical protein
VPQSVTINRTSTIDIARHTNVSTCEHLLTELPEATTTDGPILRVASQFGAEFFADVWAAILVGTICRRQYPNLKIITWGQKQWSPRRNFATTLPGITAIQLSGKVRTESTDQHIDIDEIERAINQNGGLLETLSGKTRTLIEFDPQSSIAPKIRAKTPYDRGILFKDLILRFRRDLELGYKNYGQSVHDRGDIGVLTGFLGELHDNAFRYSRTTSYNDLSQRGIRYVRLRAHLGTTKKELQARARNNPIVEEYLNQSSTLGVMEASVSDFGNGIVDHFLSSQRGQPYREHKRRDLLDQLVHTSLSSSGNPAAGHGLPRVLDAARHIHAFVSLRTAEFWLTQSFLHRQAPSRLQDVPPQSGQRSKVAGTHWQFLWPLLGT